MVYVYIRFNRPLTFFYDTIYMKVAIYVRVSKYDGSQDVTRQISDLTEFANSKNWEVVEVVQENISGRRKKREGTEKLINLARSNRIKKVLIHEVSRLGRNISDVFRTVEALTENKVSVFDLNTQQETLDRNGDKSHFATVLLPVMAGMSETWVRDHSKRIKSGLKQAKKKGFKLGRPPLKKFKNEDEVLYQLQIGTSLRKTAEVCAVGKDTVIKVKKKHIDKLDQTTF